METFQVIAPAPGSERPWVGHLPHSSTRLPSDVRAGIWLGDAALERQLVLLTDHHTDRLFDWLSDAGATLFVNRCSRLVVDPERFPDDDLEPMAARGQGAIYTRATDGSVLRDADPAVRADLLARYFLPYHAALTTLVDRLLERFGRCLILDGHSFGTRPLPSERDQAPDRPDVCLGTDPDHTPEPLVAALEGSFRSAGFSVKRDSPFAGALVPLAHHGRDRRVASVMIEVRRGLYCDEDTGEPLAGFAAVRERIRDAVLGALGAIDA